MLCPHCGIGISEYSDEWCVDCYPIPVANADFDEGYNLVSIFCPECNKYIVFLQHGTGYEYRTNHGSYLSEIDDDEILLYPKFPVSKEISLYVPPKYADLYLESSQVNVISPRASATLSRYLLQLVLHEELKIKKKNLEEEIAVLENNPSIPSTVVAMLQVFRRVANFGAHPKKSTNSKEIIEVERGEAEVMLELIDELFDYVFVKPKQQEEFLKNISDKYGI